MSEPLYCTGCGREWGCGECSCPEDDHASPLFGTGPICHVCGYEFTHCPCEGKPVGAQESNDEGDGSGK